MKVSILQILLLTKLCLGELDQLSSLSEEQNGIDSREFNEITFIRYDFVSSMINALSTIMNKISMMRDDPDSQVLYDSARIDGAETQNNLRGTVTYYIRPQVSQKMKNQDRQKIQNQYEETSESQLDDNYYPSSSEYGYYGSSSSSSSTAPYDDGYYYYDDDISFDDDYWTTFFDGDDASSSGYYYYYPYSSSSTTSTAADESNDISSSDVSSSNTDTSTEITSSSQDTASAPDSGSSIVDEVSDVSDIWHLRGHGDNLERPDVQVTQQHQRRGIPRSIKKGVDKSVNTLLASDFSNSNLKPKVELTERFAEELVAREVKTMGKINKLRQNHELNAKMRESSSDEMKNKDVESFAIKE